MKEEFYFNECLVEVESGFWYFLDFDWEIFGFFCVWISFPDLIMESIIVVLIECLMSENPIFELNFI